MDRSAPHIVVRNGTVLVPPALPDGRYVLAPKAATRKSSTKTPRRKGTKSKASAEALPGFGMWKDRLDLGRTTEEVVKTLRDRAMGSRRAR
jgi:hypothetical protein